MWHAVEEAAIFGEEEQTNKDDEDPEPSSKLTKSKKAKSLATKGERHHNMF